MEGGAVTLEEMFDRNGYDTVEINGQDRYVTRDDNGVAHMSEIKRHRRPSRWLRRWREGHVPSQPVQNDAEATIVLPTGDRVAVEVTTRQIGRGSLGERYTIAKLRWSERLHSKRWHEAVRHVAVDIAVWAGCASLAAVMVKAAWFVVML
jgi:hypothetical protein